MSRVLSDGSLANTIVEKDEIYFNTGGRSDLTFQLFIGGRGVGKTYSALRNLIFNYKTMEFLNPEEVGKFLYVRRRAKEIEISTSDTANPFKKMNTNENMFVYPEYSSKTQISTFYRQVDIDDPESDVVAVGYGVALSTFSTLRGVDFSDVTTIIFDEFIPEKTAMKLRGEGSAFMHMYETVARNRELEGEEPVKVMLLANSISLNSEILLEMRAVSQIASMIRKHVYRRSIVERGLYIELINEEKFKELKAKTALYKLAGDSDFAHQALDNEFTQDDFSYVSKKVPVSEYRPLICYAGQYTIYTHKSERQWYIDNRKSEAPVKLTSAQTDYLVKEWGYSYKYFVVYRKILFDDYGTKMLFDNIMDAN